jgi:hypothetical protein
MQEEEALDPNDVDELGQGGRSGRVSVWDCVVVRPRSFLCLP